MDSYCQSQRGRLTLKPPLQIVIPNRRCGNGSICVASPDRFDDVPVAHRASLAHVGGTQNRWKKETDRRDEGVFGVYFVICPGGTGQCASQMWMAMKACGSWGFDFEGGVGISCHLMSLEVFSFHVQTESGPSWFPLKLPL